MKQKFVLSVLFLLLGSCFLMAYEKDGHHYCDLCNQRIFKTMYTFHDRAIGGEVKTCKTCAEIGNICFLCGLPVLTNYTTLVDGRILCERDNREAIHSEDEVRKLCSEVQEELNRDYLRFMTFPTTNVVVSAVGLFKLENLFKTSGYDHCVSIFGATASHVLGDEHRYMHDINILSDLRKSRLLAVCAHECTHTWINENLSKQRKAVIASEAMEGFCEFMAFKLMESHREAFEMETIKKSDYTKGQVTAMLEAEKQYGLNDLLDWMKFGEDPRIDINNLARIRVLQEKVVRPTQVATFFPVPVQAPAPPAPTTLLLKGISGSSQRRFALINDSTFEALERGKVRLGQTNVVLRCLEIRSNSVVVQLDGSREKKELFLRALK